MQEIMPETISISGKDYPIKRLPLRKIFQFVGCVQDFLGDIYDMVQGNLPPETIAKMREISLSDISQEEKDAKANALISSHFAGVETGVTAIMKKLLTKEETFYELVALCLNPAIDGNALTGKDLPTEEQVEFVADNVYLSDAVKIVVTVMKAELTEDFFGQIMEGQNVLKQAGVFGTDTFETDESLTSTNGFGNSSPSLEADGPATLTPIPS